MKKSCLSETSLITQSLNMDYRYLVGGICLVLNVVLYVYNRFYFQEALKANQQIGIPLHSRLEKLLKINSVFISAVFIFTFTYVLYLLIVR